MTSTESTASFPAAASDVITTDYRPWKGAEEQPALQWNLPVFTKWLTSVSPGPLRIVDIGCGNGSFSAALARLGHSVVGIDVDSSGLAIARDAYPFVRFERMSIYDDPLQLGTFDVVTAAEVIEHCFKPRELFHFGRRVLRPGGRLMLSTPYHGYLKNLAIAVCNRWDCHHTTSEDGGHIKFFSVRTIEEMIHEMKFGILDRKFMGRCWKLWKGMAYLLSPL
jgi:2-polyprenyl-3-methyl-5-hydroxy-6-metoxy-1,4-benzoquinol methylase